MKMNNTKNHNRQQKKRKNAQYKFLIVNDFI